MTRTILFWSALVAVCVLVMTGAASGQADPVQKFIDSKALQNAYNGVVVDYVLNEGKAKLSDAQRKLVLDQLVAGLRAKTQVSKDEQLSAALGNLAGVLMGAAGGDIVGTAGVDVQSQYAGEWGTWVDAADKLAAAGYVDDAVSFYKFGMVNIPYEFLRARCVTGLAQAKPDDAYAILMEALKKPDDELRNTALRMLGYMGGTEGLPQARRDAIFQTLVEYSKGMTHSLNYQAAIYGLDQMRDPRAIEPLSRFRKGMSVSEMDRRPALRSLLVTYKDQSVVEDLTKKLKTGMMSTNKPDDRFVAGVTLMLGGRQEGFDWAATELKPKKGGMFATKENVDLRPDLVGELVRIGGERAVKSLLDAIGAYKDDEWLKTWMAIGLLELGNTSHMALAKAALGKPGWDFTAVRVATALAKNGDVSGIPVLKTLTEKKSPEGLPKQLLGILSGQDPQAEKDQLAYLRLQIGTALGEINHPDVMPIMTALLRDPNLDVRASAANGLCEMTDAAALPGLRQAMTTDYGLVNQTPRSPALWAHVLRSTLGHFPKDPGTKAVIDAAAASPDPAVQFMAVLARK